MILLYSGCVQFGKNRFESNKSSDSDKVTDLIVKSAGAF